MSTIRRLVEAGVVSMLVVGVASAALAQGRGNGNGTAAQVEALEAKVADLEAQLDEIEAISDLDCPNNFPFFTRPGLAVNRYGSWECAKPTYVEEEVEVEVGDRHAYATVRCPSPLLPISGGTGASSFTVPPDSGSLVLADSGWGPDARDWHARWVTIDPTTGATRATTLTVGVFCM